MSVVFKQSYKSRNDPKSRILNIKYLTYIATRKGCVYNNGLSFGLFGKIGLEHGNLNDFEYIKSKIYDASDKTVYRAIISLPDDIATAHDMYNRENIQALIQNNIHNLTKEMDIKFEQFEYVASFHQEKGHPHVHIMYYTTEPGKILESFMPKERFEIMSERVRISFNRDLYKEEISSMRTEVTTKSNALKDEVLSMFYELCETEPLNYNYVRDGKILEVGKNMYDLLHTLPKTGSLRYKYLNTYEKEKVDTLISNVLSTPSIDNHLKQFLKMHSNINALYGGDETHMLNKASHKLNQELGNMILKYIKAEQLIFPFEKSDIHNQILSIVYEHKKVSLKYSELVSNIPQLASKFFVDSKVYNDIYSITKDIIKNPEVRQLIKVYSSINSNEFNSKYDSKSLDDDKKFSKDFKDLESQLLFKEVRHILLNDIYEKTYSAQFNYRVGIKLLSDACFFMSGKKNQSQAKLRVERRKFETLSREEKKDLKYKNFDIEI